MINKQNDLINIYLKDYTSNFCKLFNKYDFLCLKIAELLLENGADPNLVNERGSSPLLVVCQFNNLSKLNNFEIFNSKSKNVTFF
jgi:ankyrin repeat protein